MRSFEIFEFLFNLAFIMNLEINLFQETEILFNQGLSIAQIREHLLSKGLSETELQEHLKLIKSFKFKKQCRLGFKLIALGALMCIASCLLTFFHDYSTVYTTFTLYGITLCGVSLVLTGLVLVFGG
jgi:hypothetical protein